MKYYTIQDVARLSEMSQKTIRRHIYANKLIAEKVSNRYRISDENYKNWIKSDKIIDDISIFVSEVDKPTELETIEWEDISDLWTFDGWSNVKYRNGYNFIDLFSGAGGLSCGFTMAGFTPVGSVEIMKEAIETYKYNFVDQKGFDENVEARDIRDNSVKSALYDSVEGVNVDVIIGGFPCQGFSMSGHRVVADPRNSLYLEMLTIVEKIKPRFIVMENVEGLRSMLDGKVELKIIEDYKKIGYNVSAVTLNSADYGVPQIRKRVIFIGNRLSSNNIYPKPIYTPEMYNTLGDGIKRFLNMPENKLINHIFTNHSSDMIKKISDVPEGKSLYKNYSDAWKKSPWNKPSCTVKENHGGVNLHPKLPRVLTPRELASLQSFPDDFIFKGSKKWQLVQIGNAVPPLLGKAIGISILKSIKKEEKFKR